jgi:uncharacterized protein (TIGR02217 family)
MAFHEVRFPLGIAFGSSGGPERRTEVVTLGSGREERNSPWALSRRRFNAGFGVKSLDDIYAVTEFFEARHGRLHGFRWKDRTDFSSTSPSVPVSPLDQIIGAGDGTEAVFQLKKQYSSGGATYVREINKPVENTVRLSVDGAVLVEGDAFVIDYTSGLVTFLGGSVPGVGCEIACGFEFDVPVRFDSDFLEINLAAFDAGDIPSIPLVELRI